MYFIYYLSLRNLSIAKTRLHNHSSKNTKTHRFLALRGRATWPPLRFYSHSRQHIFLTLGGSRNLATAEALFALATIYILALGGLVQLNQPRVVIHTRDIFSDMHSGARVNSANLEALLALATF